MKQTKEKTRNQKRNLKVAQDMCDEANYRSSRDKANYYVIQEYEHIRIFNQQEIDIFKDDYSCKKCDWIGEDSERKTGRCPKCRSKVETFIGSEFFNLIYTIKYKKPVNSFEDAKEAANEKAETGGIWHVIKIEVKALFRTKSQYVEVYDNWIKKNPEAKSLYKVGVGENTDAHLKNLGYNRAQRRKILKNKK